MCIVNRNKGASGEDTLRGSTYPSTFRFAHSTRDMISVTVSTTAKYLDDPALGVIIAHGSSVRDSHENNEGIEQTIGRYSYPRYLDLRYYRANIETSTISASSIFDIHTDLMLQIYIHKRVTIRQSSHFTTCSVKLAKIMIAIDDVDVKHLCSNIFFFLRWI